MNLSSRISRRCFSHSLIYGLVFVLAGCRDERDTLQSQIRLAASTYGLIIGCDSPSTFFIPPYRVEDGLSAGSSATQVHADRALLAIEEIFKEIKKYPKGFFTSLCSAIFLCDTLLMEGVKAGGTFGPKWIILAAGEAMSDASVQATARLGLHHEFSSLIFRGDIPLQAAWARQMPSGWTPALSAAVALASDVHAQLELKKGILTVYGGTSIENDFNTYAEVLFTEPAKLRSLCETYPTTIAPKTSLLLNSYIRRDQRFIEVFDRQGFEAIRKIVIDQSIRVSPITLPGGHLLTH